MSVATTTAWRGAVDYNLDATLRITMLLGALVDGRAALFSGGYVPLCSYRSRTDDYEQDQTLAVESEQDGGDRGVHYQIRDNTIGLFTPEEINAFENDRKLPRNTPRQLIARRRALEAVISRYGPRDYHALTSAGIATNPSLCT